MNINHLMVIQGFQTCSANYQMPDNPIEEYFFERGYVACQDQLAGQTWVPSEDIKGKDAFKIFTDMLELNEWAVRKKLHQKDFDTGNDSIN